MGLDEMESQPPARFGFETLDVYQRAIQLTVLVADIVGSLPPGQGALADQLRRASLSVPLNIAEGSGRRRPSDSGRHRAIARGSAMECAAILDVCGALKLVDSARQERARSLLLRIVQMLSKMCD